MLFVKEHVDGLVSVDCLAANHAVLKVYFGHRKYETAQHVASIPILYMHALAFVTKRIEGESGNLVERLIKLEAFERRLRCAHPPHLFLYSHIDG